MKKRISLSMFLLCMALAGANAQGNGLAGISGGNPR